jgi:membrane carboxypeptidase/penicillin-binding protein
VLNLNYATIPLIKHIKSDFSKTAHLQPFSLNFDKMSHPFFELRLFVLFKYVKFAFWTVLFGVGVSGVAGAALYYQTLGDLPDVEQLKEVTFETPMKIYSADNKLIGEFGESKRIPVALDKIPLKMRQAFLAIEDTRFYDHSGIDPIGIVRAAIVAATSASAKQGASTITQQVARNFFLTREKTLKRKIKEVFISLRIEQVSSILVRLEYRLLFVRLKRKLVLL